MRGRIVGGLSVGAVLACVASAQALTVSETKSSGADFAGSGCGSQSVAHVFVPAHAPLTDSRPRSGAVLIDDETGQPVARLQPTRVRVNGKHAVRFTATGSDDVCTNPAAYTEAGWGASLVPLSITYRIKRRVYFRSYIMGSYLSARYRPRRIFFGERSLVRGVRWSRWNGRVARGHGTLLYNDCNPNCADARPRYYRLNVRLSRVERCGRRYDYTRFSFRYPGAKPAGRPRTYAERHTCRRGTGSKVVRFYANVPR